MTDRGDARSDARARWLSRVAVDAALLVMVVLWAANMVVLKLLLGTLPPPALSAVRFLVITLVAGAVLAISGGPWTVERRDVPRLLIASVSGISLYQVLFMEGLHRTSAFASNVLQGTEPLFALLLVSLAGTERVAPHQWGGVLVAFAGTVVFFLQEAGGRTSFAFGLGDLLNLTSAGSFAVYGLLSQPLFARYPGRTVMGLTMAAGTLPLVAYAAPDLATFDWGGLTPVVWAGTVASGVVAVYLGFWVWNWAIARKGLAHASLYVFLEILMSGFFTWIFLGERFGPFRLAGTGVILVGLRLARRGPDAPAG